MMMMMKTNMAINSIEIALIKRWLNFKLFTELIVVLLVIDLVAGHPETVNVERQHSDHVCNHQHPKADDVRQFLLFYIFRVLEFVNLELNALFLYLLS